MKYSVGLSVYVELARLNGRVVIDGPSPVNFSGMLLFVLVAEAEIVTCVRLSTDTIVASRGIPAPVTVIPGSRARVDVTITAGLPACVEPFSVAPPPRNGRFATEVPIPLARSLTQVGDTTPT